MICTFCGQDHGEIEVKEAEPTTPLNDHWAIEEICGKTVAKVELESDPPYSGITIWFTDGYQLDIEGKDLRVWKDGGKKGLPQITEYDRVDCQGCTELNTCDLNPNDIFGNASSEQCPILVYDPNEEKEV